MAFLTTPQAIGVLGGFAGIFIIIMIIGCLLKLRRKPRTRRKSRNEWVRERQAEVRRLQDIRAEEQRQLRENIRRNREGSAQSMLSSGQRADLEGGLRAPPPARIETLPTYERALSAKPAPLYLQQQGRAGSESSVPSYNAAVPSQARTKGNDSPSGVS